MAKKKAKAKTGGGGGGAATVMLVLVILVALSVTLAPTALLVAVGLVPGLVAFICDRDPARTATLSVLMCNVVGVLPFVIDLWQAGHELEMAVRLVRDPIVWGVIYCAAGFGWLMLMLVPPIIGRMGAMGLHFEIARLEQERKQIVDAWGDDVVVDLQDDLLSM